jgi:hypothetical protein
MARVPTYDGTQVATAPLQPVMQRTPDVSSGLMAASRALGQVAEVADRQVMRDAEAEANTVDAKITADWLQWQADNGNKFQGANAGQYETEAKAWWDKAKSQYAEDVSPMALGRLNRVLPAKQNQALSGVLSRVATEKERHADESAEAAVQTNIEMGIDSGDVAGARQQVRTITAQQATRKGWTPEQLQAEQQRRLSTLHLAYVTRLSTSDAAQARAYYEANKGEIGAQFQARVEQVLTAEADDQFAAKFAAERAGKPLAEQLQEAGAIENPARREKALQQIKNNQALLKVAQQEREMVASDEAWQMVGQGRKVPERTLSVMNGRERVQLQDYLRQRAEHQAKEGLKPVRSDPLVLARLYDMARDDPDAFKAQRMEALAYSVAGSDLEQLARLQRDMRDPGKEKDAISVSMQIGSYTRGMNPNQRALFESAAQSDVIRFQDENKRPPTSKERQQMFDQLKLEGTIERSFWFDSTKPRYQMTAEEQARATFAPPAGTPAQLPRVTSEAQYNNLPKGARYVAPDGTTRTKQ